ncbi:hypothetical protein Tco_0693446 [Tanacetum coccineum]
MASMNTRLNIEKLDGNIVQKHGGSKQAGLKQLGSKQVGFKQLGHKQVGFKQLGPGVETGFHGVKDEKRVWFEVELHGAQGDCKAEVFQVSNNDPVVAQRRLEDKQPEEKTNTDFLVKEQENVHLGIKVGANIMVTGVPGQEGAEGTIAEKKKVKESMKANLRKLLKYKAWSWLFQLSQFIRIHQRIAWGHLLDELSYSDIPNTPPSPTHGTPFTETTLSTQRSPTSSGALRRRVVVLAPGQPIPYGRPYHYHLNGSVHMMTARKRVRPMPTHRLAVRHSVDYSSSDHFSLDDSSRDSSSSSSSESSLDSSADALFDSASSRS